MLNVSDFTDCDQINKSRDQIAYNVIDAKRTDSPANATWADLQQNLTMIDEVLNTRFIAGPFS